MPTAIGIDLGTTHTAVAYYEDGEINVIQSNAGDSITPSVVHFGADGVILVGKEAIAKSFSTSRRTVSEIKRFMGRNFDDERLKKRSWPFEVVRGSEGRVGIQADGDSWSPEEISAIILKEMKKLASKYVEDVKDAVITVPSHFSNVQRKATAEAAEIAGLNVLRIINEPTAAAIAFNHNFPSNRKKNILVYDLGGGTFDVSIVEIHGMKSRVLATDGSTFLGGRDFDLKIYEEAVARFKEDEIDILDGNIELLARCEQAKRHLAKKDVVSITHRTHKGEEAEVELTYDTFFEICEELVDETIRLVDRALADSKISKSSLDEIILVGGSTRLRPVRERIARHFPSKEIRTNFDPDLAIVRGAAILAASLAKENEGPRSTSNAPRVDLIDVTPLSLGIKADDRMSIIIPKNTPLPASSFKMYTSADKTDLMLTLEVVEGENQADFTRLAQFMFLVLPSFVRKSELVFQVSFAIDESGILTVSAKDPELNSPLTREVKSSNLSADERCKLTKQLNRLTINS